MQKTITVMVEGNKDEVFAIQVFLKTCETFNKLGVPFLHALQQTLELTKADPNRQ